MKIVFCAFDGKNIINGINAWLLRLLPSLSANGIDITVLFIAWAREDECTIIPILREAGVRCIVIPAPHYSERIVKWILEYLILHQPDIFVANHMPQALYATKWLSLNEVSTVMVLHNDDDEYSALVEEFLTKAEQAKISAVIPVSTILYNKIEHFKDSVLVKRIPYGAPVPLSKAKFPKKGPFKLAYVGRIVKKQKNIDTVTKAFCEIAIHNPDIEANIYGSGPDEGIVNDILKHYGNPTNVFFNGNLSSEKVEEKLLASHIFVLMSDFEGIPVALMEAMSCGVVPICKRIESGIPELIVNSKTGFFIDDIEDLISKVILLKNTPEAWEKMSNNARNLIEKSFSTDNNNTEWFKLLQELKPKSKIKSFNIPHNLKLPAVHQQLESHDIREPSFTKKIRKKIKLYLDILLSRS